MIDKKRLKRRIALSFAITILLATWNGAGLSSEGQDAIRYLIAVFLAVTVTLQIISTTIIPPLLNPPDDFLEDK